MKTDDRCITQLAKMSIDPEFVELTADVVRIFLLTLVPEEPYLEHILYTPYIAYTNGPFM